MRAVCDPDNVRAEFAHPGALRPAGQGPRPLADAKDRAYARAQGLQRLVGVVLRENADMLDLALRLGFVEKPSDDGDDLRAIELEL